MGGIEIAAITGAASIANELYSSKKKRDSELKTIRTKRAQNAQNKRNILEQQLASRRAKIGSLGVSSSGSNAVINKRMIDETEREISNNNQLYKIESDSIKDSYNSQLLNKGLNNVTQAVAGQQIL